MIQKKKKQIKLIILIAIIAMLITGGAIWFLNSNGLRNESLRNSLTDGKVDFSSKALVVVTDSDLENKYNATSFNKTYSGKYVLSFETEEATKKAYEELNFEISEMCSGMSAFKQQKIQRIISKAMSLASFKPENRKESSLEEKEADMHGNKVKSMFKNLKLK